MQQPDCCRTVARDEGTERGQVLAARDVVRVIDLAIDESSFGRVHHPTELSGGEHPFERARRNPRPAEVATHVSPVSIPHTNSRCIRCDGRISWPGDRNHVSCLQEVQREFERSGPMSAHGLALIRRDAAMISPAAPVGTRSVSVGPLRRVVLFGRSCQHVYPGTSLARKVGMAHAFRASATLVRGGNTRSLERVCC